jgi:hypothetical protein
MHTAWVEIKCPSIDAHKHTHILLQQQQLLLLLLLACGSQAAWMHGRTLRRISNSMMVDALLFLISCGYMVSG